jgi:RimJ/RimL family protein N-acetyltransferase
MFSGKNVTLRSIEEADLEQLRIWRNTPLLRKYFREYTEISQSDQRFWYQNIVLPKKTALMFAIEDKKSQCLLGACGLCYIDRVRKSADFSIYIGYKDIYLDKIYAVESAELLITYGFEELGLHRLWAEVYSHDFKKQDFFQSLGFTLDGRLRESHWSEGVWLDSLYYSLLESD